MAKQKNPRNLKGKVGGIIYKTGAKGKQEIEIPKLTKKQKTAAGTQPQNLRTGVLNKLASGILHAVRYYGGSVVHTDFFTDSLKEFRKERTDHCILLLQKIINNEVHPTYTFGAVCPRPLWELSIKKNEYVLEVEIVHGAKGKKGTNCYYLEFILLAWNKEDGQCRHECISTDWMNTGVQKRVYATMKFPRRAGDADWLLVCRYAGGVNQVERSFTDSAMYFAGCGTLTAEGKKILEERKAEEEAARNSPPEKRQERVKNRVGVREEK